MIRRIEKLSKLEKRVYRKKKFIKGFTPLEKAAEFNQRSLPYKADGGIKPLPAYTVRGRSSLTGFTLIEIIIVTAIIALLATIAIANLLRSMLMANEASAQASLRTISSALESYRAANGSYSGATFNVLAIATPAYLDSVLGSGSKHGYNFSLTVEADNQSYVCTGVPESQNISGSRSFCVSDDGVIRIQAAGGAIANYAACLALSPTQ